jgi:hypothetical protein
VRHLYQNFQRAGHRGEVLKNDLWTIARSTNVPRWQQALDRMKADSPEAYEWVEQLVPNTWIKAFFSDFPKCDLLLNNHSEVFNRYIFLLFKFLICAKVSIPIFSLMHTTCSHQLHLGGERDAYLIHVADNSVQNDAKDRDQE